MSKPRGILYAFELPEDARAVVLAQGAASRAPILDAQHPVAVCIAERASKTALEHERTQLARGLADVLREDLEVERDLAMGSANTQRQYAYELKKFKAWVEREGLSWMATHECLAHYLFARADEGVAPKTLRHIADGVRWYRKFSDSNSSYDDTVVLAALRYLTRNWKGRGKAKDKPPDAPDARAPDTMETVDAN